MFLCPKCHDPECQMHFSGSRGPCEGCGKTADCVDCRNMRKPKPKPKKPKAEPAHLPLTERQEYLARLFAPGAGLAVYDTDKNGNRSRRQFIEMERFLATLDVARAQRDSLVELLRVECRKHARKCKCEACVLVMSPPWLPKVKPGTETCSGCGKERRDVQSVGRDYNGDPDAPDLCFLCRKKGSH